jgi:carbamate kinase
MGDMSNNGIKTKRAVIALGGNAISNRQKEDNIPNQFDNTFESLKPIVELIKEGYQLVITHGNGPQVGNALLRVELAREKAPNLPLYICVADLQGGMGYMIAQSLKNRLRSKGIHREVMTLITQVLVEENDPAFQNPTKYIGQFYTEEQAKELQKEMGWSSVAKFHNSEKWRRVVPSPTPIALIEKDTLRKLVENNIIVIAAGGGGIPVIQKEGQLSGVDAVIDKDFTAAVMANELDAELLLILTDIEQVSINYRKPDQMQLGEVSLAQMKKYLSDGHFPSGSMGPKIEASIKFLENGGKQVIITSLEKGFDAVVGKAGTRIIN